MPEITVALESLLTEQQDETYEIYDRVCSAKLDDVYLRGGQKKDLKICADSTNQGDLDITPRSSGRATRHAFLRDEEVIKL